MKYVTELGQEVNVQFLQVLHYPVVRAVTHVVDGGNVLSVFSCLVIT